MMIYIFEANPVGGCEDYGSTHFNIIASTEREAWKKACEIEYRENIIGIVRSKAIL